jgi:hypothetical protein
MKTCIPKMFTQISKTQIAEVGSKESSKINANANIAAAPAIFLTKKK